MLSIARNYMAHFVIIKLLHKYLQKMCFLESTIYVIFKLQKAINVDMETERKLHPLSLKRNKVPDIIPLEPTSLVMYTCMQRFIFKTFNF